MRGICANRRVVEQLNVTMRGDSSANRRSARKVLRACGVTRFSYMTAYDIMSDRMILRVSGMTA
jgi:hypothetical protein